MASVLSRSSLRLLWVKQPLELSLVKQSSAASAANLKYQSDLDSIKQVTVPLSDPIITVT